MAATIQNIELPKKPRARDTSGNNNHGKIYSGRGLEFDGVTDYLDTGSEITVSTGAWTVAAWINIHALTEAVAHHVSSASSAISSKYIGVRANGKIAIWDYGVTWRNANTVLNLNTWYRALWVYDGAGEVTFYVNGVADGTGVLASTYDDLKIRYIGALSDNRYFNGKMSDYQAWDAAFTADDAAYDYLNPESLALNASGTALTEGNLKLWYPMQDGHRGQQSYILDGANTGLGVEELTNGSFTGITQAESTTGSEWTTNAGWSIGDGVILAEAGNATKLVQTNTLNGKFCKVTLTVSNYGGAGLTLVDFGSVSSSYITSNGTHSVYGTYDQNNFEIYKTDTFSGTIDNISVKAINDKHHATTVFTGDDLWDLADNHTDNWSTTGGATKAAIGGTTDGVKLTFGGTATNENGSYIWLKDTTTHTLTEDLTVGRTYKLSGKFATDVAGATNAPRILVYAGGNNYPSPSTVPASNEVTNGTMEANDNWNAYGSGTVSQSTTQKHNGSNSFKFVVPNGGANDGTQSDTFTVTANTTYLLSAWVYPDDTTTVTIKILEGNGSTTQTENVTNLEENAWNKIERQFVNVNAGSGAAIRFTNTGTNSSGSNDTYYIDDVVYTAFIEKEIEFIATHATQNNFYHFNCDYVAANEMIEQGSNANNSTFASGIGNWVVTDDSGSNATIAHSTDAGGTITINPTTDDEVEGMLLPVSNLTDLEVGRSYTVLVRMKSTSGTPGVEVRLGNDRATAQNISDSATTYAFVVSPIVDTGALRIQTDSTDDINIIVYSCEVYPHCNLFVDDISFKEVGVASGWTDADQQLHIPQPALQSYNELAWFDGTIASNGYVDLDSAITTSGNSWSLSFWVFHDDNGQAFDFIAGNGTNQIITLTRAGTDFLSYRDSSDAYHTISDAAIPESEWVHITITATANTSITAYVNGVAQTTNSDMTNTTLLLKRFMRGFSVNLYHVFGTINEISYYSDVLTAAEVLDLFNDGKAKSALEASGSAGLVGYWRNNGLSEWKDLKGSNDGNTSAGVVETILIPEGVDATRDSQGFIMNKPRSTSSLNLTNGSDSPHVDLGSITTIADDEAFSFVVWLKPDDLAANNFIGRGSSLDWVRIHDANTIKFRADNETEVFSTSTLVAKEWVHVAIVRKASNDLVSVYINGAAGVDTETLNEPFDYRYLGSGDTANDNFRGAMDGFLIYNTALSATEVLQNYNATKRDHTN